MADRQEPEYILGTGDAELQRLGFQHRVWAEFAFHVWRRAGFGPGQHVVDAGSGPGFAGVDLAHLVGPQGHVLAVDESPRFVDHTRLLAERLALPQLEGRTADLEQLELPADRYDGAYIRWVLCFLPDPAAVLQRLAHGLRRGGVLAIQDYFHYEAIRLLPGGPAFAEAIAAVSTSWQQRGGDPNVGQRLPAMLDAAGFDLVEVQPLVRTARPHDTLWFWPQTFFRIFLPTLQDLGLLSAEQIQAFHDLWDEHARLPNAVFCTPPMIDIIARKR